MALQSADLERERACLKTIWIRHFPLAIEEKLEAEIESPPIQVLGPQG